MQPVERGESLRSARHAACGEGRESPDGTIFLQDPRTMNSSDPGVREAPAAAEAGPRMERRYTRRIDCAPPLSAAPPPAATAAVPPPPPARP